MSRILVIDNFDSFVYTLNGYVQQLGAETVVVRNNTIAETETDAVLSEYDGVLISPGPGTPSAAGVSVAMVHAAARTGTPLFGVCLGLQAIAEAYGATVTHAEELMHGKVSQVVHHGSELFNGVPTPFRATRYHSLAVVRETLPACLRVNAETASGIVMGIEHTSAPISAVQFHPESVLTEGGYQMIGNWLESLGLNGAAERASALTPLLAGAAAEEAVTATA